MKRHILYFEPYTLMFQAGQYFLIYNTLNKKRIQISIEDIIAKEILLPFSKLNTYCIELKDSTLKNRRFIDFLDEVRVKYMGDIQIIRNKLPFVQKPQLKIRKAANTIPKQKSLYDQIVELSIYYQELPQTKFPNAHKQFTFPIDNSNYYNKVDTSISLLENFFQNEYENLRTINMLGNGIDDHKKLSKILSLLKLKAESKHINFVFYIGKKQCDSIIGETFRLIELSLENVSFTLYFETFSLINKKIKILNDRTTVIFPVSSQFDYENAITTIERANLKSYAVVPYYNGSNMDFFQKNIFLTKSNIFGAKQNINEILAKGEVNSLMYGKLHIIGNNIYSNPNLNSIGSLEDNINGIIYRLIKNPSLWNKVRQNELPCSQCCYNMLCSPISNYELVLKKNDLCKIKH